MTIEDQNRDDMETLLATWTPAEQAAVARVKAAIEAMIEAEGKCAMLAVGMVGNELAAQAPD